MWFLAFGLIVLSAWIAFFAPCSYLGWLPLKDVPGRCVQGVRR